MKKILFLFLCFSSRPLFAQYWQQEVHYRIDVSLNEKEKTLDAFEKLIYINHSPDTLSFIWFHVWPNAYKNDQTALSDQMLENGNTRFYFSGKEEKGYINRLDFKVDGITARTEDHPEHIDIIKLMLPKPLAPGQQVVITTPFHEKLPFNFSRGGYDGASFQVTQWYPKPAVYDASGWHPMPYLEQGEFYSEYGSFDVYITVPQTFVVAATGVLQNEEEKQWLLQRKDYEEIKVKTATKQVNKGQVKKPKPVAPERPVSYKTLHYMQDSVHDFAWFADKNFIVNTDSCLLSSGKQVQVYSFYTPGESETWKESLQYTKDAIRFYSEQVGDYPYQTVSVVQGPESFGGGMEYPTITIISPAASPKILDVMIAHEVGHNWFYGILGSNEREHPWMDEGMNSFYEYAYTERKYGRQTQEYELLYQTNVIRHKGQPIETTSERFSTENYELVAYHHTATWLQGIEAKMGKERFEQMMHDYFQVWKFRHPQPGDFRKMVADYLPAQYQNDTSLIFRDFRKPGYQPYKGFRFVSVFNPGSMRDFLQHPAKDILLVTPLFGFNDYDKFMAGPMITNYKIAPNRFNYLFLPMYATGSKSLVGLGKLNYSIASDKLIRKADLFLNGSSFTMNEFRDTANRKLQMRFEKLVPGIKLTFRQKDPRSTVSSYLQWKTFLVREEFLRIRQDTFFNGPDTALFLHYDINQKGRYLNQLSFVYENYRALYPYHLQLTIEQAKDFIRPTFTADYFFNYREGGLQLRFFAGKFIYLNGKTLSKQFDNDRYHLNMTGPNGYEDYTYSDYFVARNNFEGAASQQLMIRDGGFKTRTELLASKIGKTDNWLAAINLNTSIPGKINPLSVLPINIPLHLFLDIGTYAEVWERDADADRFLYDFGFHIPLLDGTFNIYLPILYNKVYGDYYKSTIPKNRFLHTISFSINLYHPVFRKINQELEF